MPNRDRTPAPSFVPNALQVDPAGVAGPLSDGPSTWYVKRLHLRRLLRAREAETLLAHSTLVSAHRGALLFDPQSRGETIWWIEEGRLRLSRFRPGGQETVAAVLEEGEVLGQEPRRPFSVNDAFAEVIDSGEFRCVNRENFEAALDENEVAAVAIARQLALQHGLDATASWWGQRGLRERTARTAALLLLGAPPSAAAEHPAITLQEMALMAGSGRPALEAVVGAWIEAGMLSVHEGRLRIDDRDALAAYAVLR